MSIYSQARIKKLFEELKLLKGETKQIKEETMIELKEDIKKIKLKNTLLEEKIDSIEKGKVIGK